MKTCVDEKVPVGKHSYEVTALWHTWEATSSGQIGGSDGRRDRRLHGLGDRDQHRRQRHRATSRSPPRTKTAPRSPPTPARTRSSSPAPAPPRRHQTDRHQQLRHGDQLRHRDGDHLYQRGLDRQLLDKNGRGQALPGRAANIVATEGLDHHPEPVTIAVSATTASKYVLAAATTTPGSRGRRRADDHRPGHLRQHRHLLQRPAQPRLLRRLRQPRRQRPDGQRLQRRRRRLRRRNDDRIRRRRRQSERGRRRRDDPLQKRFDRRQSGRGHRSPRPRR